MPALTDSSLNYFYIGVDNPIEIKGVKISAKHRVIIDGGGANIAFIGNNKYIIRATYATDSCFIKIRNGKKEIFSKRLKVRIIPDQFATLCGFRDTIIRRQRLLANPFLVVPSNCYYKLYWQILSFRATFINGTDSIPTFSQGNLLSKEQIQLTKDAESGSKIYFDDIRVACPSSRTTKAPPFWIKIE